MTTDDLSARIAAKTAEFKAKGLGNFPQARAPTDLPSLAGTLRADANDVATQFKCPEGDAIRWRMREAASGIEQLEEALKDVLASLVAAHSLLSKGGKKAAPSNTMFEIMLSDYEKSIARGRTALGAVSQCRLQGACHESDARRQEIPGRRKDTHPHRNRPRYCVFKELMRGDE